jgi:hypothetical protein
MSLSTELLLAYLWEVELKISDSTTIRELNRWVVIGAYSVITYVVSLWGSEGFLLSYLIWGDLETPKS